MARTITRTTGSVPDGSFGERFQRLVKEFGSRYALAKSSGIPASTLQGYEAGSKPGMEALLTLARVGNVDLTWLLTGNGEMRPPGMQPGAVLKDFLVVSQYELGTALHGQIIVAQIPFSRDFLEKRLRLREPTSATLLAVEAGSNLLAIEKGDLVLVDRKQATLARDGIYLLNLPGLELRALFRRPDGKVDVVGPENDVDLSVKKRGRGIKQTLGSLVMTISELLGMDRRHAESKVIGRAVWVGRAV
ncbi:MAG: helix-turn-helix domain-containing protein [Candidatus Binataceae bacterium]